MSGKPVAYDPSPWTPCIHMGDLKGFPGSWLWSSPVWLWPFVRWTCGWKTSFTLKYRNINTWTFGLLGWVDVMATSLCCVGKLLVFSRPPFLHCFVCEMGLLLSWSCCRLSCTQNTVSSHQMAVPMITAEQSWRRAPRGPPATWQPPRVRRTWSFLSSFFLFVSQAGYRLHWNRKNKSSKKWAKTVAESRSV